MEPTGNQPTILQPENFEFSESSLNDSFPNIIKNAIKQRNENIALIQKFVSTPKNRADNEIKKAFKFGDHLTSSPLTIAVTGRINAGKSTFVSYLLDYDYLPIGEEPTTNIATKLLYSDKQKFRLIDPSKSNSTKKEFKTLDDPELLSDIITSSHETSSKTDQADLEILEIGVPSSLLEGNIRVIDFPGFDEKENTTKNVMNIIEILKPLIICYIYDYNQGLQMSDIKFLNQIKTICNKSRFDSLVQFVLIANKCDYSLECEFDSSHEENIDIVAENHSNFILDNLTEFQLDYQAILPILPFSAVKGMLSFELEERDEIHLKALKKDVATKIVRHSKVIIGIYAPYISASDLMLKDKTSIILPIIIPSIEDLPQNLMFLAKDPPEQSFAFSSEYKVTIHKNKEKLCQVSHIPKLSHPKSANFGSLKTHKRYCGLIYSKMSGLYKDENEYLLIDYRSPDRLIDKLGRIEDLSTVESIITQVAYENQNLETIKPNFRADNLYLNCWDEVWINRNIPNDSSTKFLLKDNLPVEPFHLMKPSENWEEKKIEEVLLAELLYSFGWFVWIMLEGTGDPQIGSFRGNTDELLKTLEKGRFPNFSEELKRVMQICWNAPNNSFDENRIQWYTVCHLLNVKERLINAAIYGNLEKMEFCIGKSVDVNERNKNGVTPLHSAAENGRLESMKRLVHSKAEINTLTKDGASPVYLAVKSNQFECAKWLLENGAQSNLCLKGFTPLYIAAKEEKIDFLELLIEFKADPNLCPYTSQQTPLYIAAQNGYLDCIKLLVDSTAKINQGNFNEETPLYIAAQENQIECIKYLLAKGAEVNKACKTGETPLYIAAKNGFAEVVNELLKYQADHNLARKGDVSHVTSQEESVCLAGIKECSRKRGETPLYVASKNGHLDCVCSLLQFHADPNISTSFGETAVYAAAFNGHTECLREILKNDETEVNCCNDLGQSPLYAAALKGNLNTVNLLIEKGAIVDIKTKKNESVLHAAVKDGQTECLRIFLKYTHNIDGVSDSGETAVFVAALTNKKDCLELLLENNADPDISNEQGDSPLIVASRKNNEECLKLLLKYGANVNSSNKDGENCLHACDRNDKSDCLKFLLNHDQHPNINLANKFGETPLYLSAKNGNYANLQLLIEHKAKVNFINNTGDTALHVAISQGHYDCVKLLVDNKANINMENQKKETPIYVAALNAQNKCMEILIDNKADPNLPTKEGDNPLHAAGYSGSKKCLELLLKYSSGWNETSKNEIKKLTSPGGEKMDLIVNMSKDFQDLMTEFDIDTILYDKENQFVNIDLSKASLKQSQCVGQHLFEDYQSVHFKLKHIIAVSSSSSQEEKTTEDIFLEIFQYLAFFQWKSVNSLLLVLPMLKEASKESITAFIEAIISATILFCHYGLPLDKIVLNFSNYSDYHDLIIEQFNLMGLYYDELIEKNQSKELPFMLLHYGHQCRKDLAAAKNHSLKALLRIGCFYDMEVYPRFSYRSEAQPLEMLTLQLVNYLKPTELLMIFKSHDPPWKPKYELISLLAIVQQKRNGKKFVLIKQPISQPVTKYPPPSEPQSIFDIGQLSVTESSFPEAIRAVGENVFYYFQQQGQKLNDRNVLLTSVSETQPFEYDVTILYHNLACRDAFVANKLKTKLKQSGFKVFKLKEGEEEENASHETRKETKTVVEAIRKSRIVLSLISKDFLSNWNRGIEFRTALHYHSLQESYVTLLPFVLSNDFQPDTPNVSEIFKKEAIFLLKRSNSDTTEPLSNPKISFIARTLLTKGENNVIIHDALSQKLKVDAQPNGQLTMWTFENFIIEWIRNFVETGNDFPNAVVPLPVNFRQVLNPDVLQIEEILMDVLNNP